MDNERKFFLVQELNSIKSELNIAVNEITRLKSELKMAILIDDKVIGNANIESIKDDLESLANELSDLVIPKIK